MKKDWDITALLLLILSIITILYLLFQSWQRSHEIEDTLKRPALFETIKK